MCHPCAPGSCFGLQLFLFSLGPRLQPAVCIHQEECWYDGKSQRNLVAVEGEGKERKEKKKREMTGKEEKGKKMVNIGTTFEC